MKKEVIEEGRDKYKVKVFMPHNETQEFFAMDYEWMFDYKAIKFEVRNEDEDSDDFGAKVKIIYVGGGTVIIDEL